MHMRLPSAAEGRRAASAGQCRAAPPGLLGQCHHYNVRIMSLQCAVSPSPRDTFHSPDTRPPFSRISPAERPGSSASLYREDMQTCGWGTEAEVICPTLATLRDLTMFSANSSAWLPAAAPGTLRSRDFPFAAADRDLAALLSAPGDLARLEDLAPRAIDLCGVSGSLRVVLQMRSRMPEPPPVT